MLAPGTGKLAPKQIHNHAAVPESRQPVMSGLESHLLARLDQTVFEIENAQPGAQARFQLFGVKGFSQVIIGPGFESCDDVLFRLFGCEQHHVDIRLLCPFPDFAANARSIQLGHHPVQQSKPWSVRRAQLIRRQAAVLYSSDFIARALQGSLEQPPRHDFVIGNQNPHPCTSAMQASSCGNRLVAALSKAARASRNPAVSPLRPNCSKRPTAAAAWPAARFKSIPFKVWAATVTSFPSPDSTASRKALRCRGNSSLKIVRRSCKSSRSLSTRASSSASFTIWRARASSRELIFRRALFAASRFTSN